MLTKDHLLYKRKKDTVTPSFLDPENVVVQDKANVLINLFESCVNQSQAEIKEAVSEALEQYDNVSLGFEKLLMDRCEFQTPDESIQEKRWDIILLAERLREEKIFSSLEEYREAISEHSNINLKDIENSLYCDLPECKKVLDFKKISAPDLIHRYNCAQIQGLLIYSKNVRIIFDDISNSDKRSLFRRLRFHQLLVEVKRKDPLEVELSGPLSIFDSGQKYGIKLANFFPYLLHLPNFKLNAKVVLKQGEFDLSVDQKCAIKSHYKYSGAYIPEEFEQVVKIFNSKSDGFDIKIADDFLNIGRQSYCFPDFCVSGKKLSKPIYIELFHKWHKFQLKSRLLSFVQLKKKPRLVFGLCKSIEKDGDIKEIIENNEELAKHIFYFRDFPSYKQIDKSLKNILS